MFVRALVLSLVLAAPVMGQGLFNRPPKPKVVTTPTPAPATPTPATPATPADPKPKPPRKRPPVKPAAPSTAPTAYMAKVKAAFAARWVEALTPLADAFTPGNVSVVFTLDAEGKVTAFKITENTANDAFGKFCHQFVQDTVFEKPPERALVDGSLEIPFTFWLY